MDTIPQKRFFLIVLDGCGAGEMPDAVPLYGQSDRGANTLANTARFVGGLSMPALQKLGWGNVTAMDGVAPAPNAPAYWGRLAEASLGKDTVTGHWEMMGVHTAVRVPDLSQRWLSDRMSLPRLTPITGRETFSAIIRAASGTEIIQSALGEEHVTHRQPHRLHVRRFGVSSRRARETPHIFGLGMFVRSVCERARALLTPPHNVGRVIAPPVCRRPCPGNFKRTENRRDYPLASPARHGVWTRSDPRRASTFTRWAKSPKSSAGAASRPPTRPRTTPAHIEAAFCPLCAGRRAGWPSGLSVR